MNGIRSFQGYNDNLPLGGGETSLIDEVLTDGELVMFPEYYLDLSHMTPKEEKEVMEKREEMFYVQHVPALELLLASKGFVIVNPGKVIVVKLKDLGDDKTQRQLIKNVTVPESRLISLSTDFNLLFKCIEVKTSAGKTKYIIYEIDGVNGEPRYLEYTLEDEFRMFEMNNDGYAKVYIRESASRSKRVITGTISAIGYNRINHLGLDGAEYEEG